MIDEQQSLTGTAWLGAVVMLFGLLFLASQANELLKQTVITPGSVAEMGVAANCRVDELEEEGLSLQECQLMVSSVQIILASSPGWFRSFQIALSSIGSIAAILSLLVGISLVNEGGSNSKLAIISFSTLLLIDVVGFVAATNTGPLLRAQYLWPLLLWFFIHLCILLAVVEIKGGMKGGMRVSSASGSAARSEENPG